MGLLLSLRAKGAVGLAARAGMISSRFGTTPARMKRYLHQYVDLTQEFGVNPTLPITASVLARHPQLIRELAERGVEFGVHGLVHNDHAVLSLAEQRASIARAIAIFESAGVPCAGFRGPYLRYNSATNEAVRTLGLLYHSSQAVAFTVLPAGLEDAKITAYRRALALYSAIDAAKVVGRPRDEQGLITIPVAVPDDEIMVDRLNLNSLKQSSVWRAMLDATYHRGELFTLQFHPERVLHSADALRAVLAEARAREPGVWVARLDEIASWWRRRQHSRLTVQQTGHDCHRVHLEGDPEGVILVRGLPTVDAIPWYGRQFVASTRTFDVRGPIKPIVGVSPRSTCKVVDFLREEGLPTEISEDRSRFGAYVDITGSEFDEVSLLSQIDAAPGPLVQLWRWPRGARGALAVTGDIDSVTLQDFALRLWETRRRVTVDRPERLGTGPASA